MQPRPRVPLLCPRCLPVTFGGRPLYFLPDRQRRARNFALMLAVTQAAVSMFGLAIGAARTAIAQLSSGLHAALLLTAVVGVVGAWRMSAPALVLHGIIAVGIPLVFWLVLLLTIFASQGGRNNSDAIVIVVFISFILDVVAGVASLVAAMRLNQHLSDVRQQERAHAAAADAPAGATGTAAVRPAEPPHHSRPPIAPQADVANPLAAAALRAGILEPMIDGGPVVPPNFGLRELPRKLDGRGGGGGGSSTAGDARTPGAGAGAGAAAPVAPDALQTAGGTTVMYADDGRCIVCMDRRRDTAFVPCGHMACAACAETIQTRNHRCHVCRRPIRSSLRLFD